MNKSLRKVVYWGALLSVYFLMVATVIRLLAPDDQFNLPLAEVADLAVEKDDNTDSPVELVRQSEEMSGVFVPLGPEEGQLPGNHAVWNAFERALHYGDNSKTGDGFDGVQAVAAIRDFSIGSVSDVFLSGAPRQIFRQESLLYLLNEKQQVQIIDCKEPSRPRVMTSLPYVDIRHMEMQGTIAFLLLDRKDAPAVRLLVVDLKNPVKPRELAWLELPDNTVSFFFVNSQLVVYSKKTGPAHEGSLHLYDLNDRFQLSLRGRAKSPKLGEGFMRHGNYVLNPELHEGLSVYDFSDPLHPEQLAFLGNIRIDHMASYDDLVFASGPGGDLYVLDLQNPRQPILSLAIDEAGPSAFFVEYGSYIYFFTFNGYLHVFDHSAPDVHTYDKMHADASAERMSLSADDAFVLFGTLPALSASSVLQNLPSATPESVVDHLLWKDSMVVLDHFGVLYFYPKAGDSSSILKQSLRFANSPQWLAAGDDYLFIGGKEVVNVVAAGRDGIASVVGAINFPGKETWDGLVLNETLFVAAGKDGLLSCSLRRPEAPVVSTGWNAPAHLSAQVDIRHLAASDDDQLFFTAGQAGFFGARLDSDSHFILKGFLRFSDAANAVAVQNGLALVSTEKEIFVVDVRDEHSLQNLGKIAFSGVTDITVAPSKLWAGYSAKTRHWSVLPFPCFLREGDQSLPGNDCNVSPTGSHYKLHVFNDREVKVAAGTVVMPGSQGDQAGGGGALVY